MVPGEPRRFAGQAADPPLDELEPADDDDEDDEPVPDPLVPAEGEDPFAPARESVR